MDQSTGHIDAAGLLRLLEVARQLAAPAELRELLKRVIDAGRDVLRADRGTVFLYDAPARELYALVATGEGEIRFSIDRGIAGACARDRAIVNVPDCYADPRFNPEVDRRTGYHTQCLIAVPLIGLEDELVGVLSLLNSAKGRFDAEDQQLAAVLASQAAVALQRARLLGEREVKVKLERDLELARQLQLGVLPQRLPACPGYDLAAFIRPADRTGGDIYDVVPIPHSDPDSKSETRNAKLLLLLADATGHGIGPALSVVQVRAMLRVGLRLNGGLDDLVTHINGQLLEDLPPNRFVTAFVGVLDPQAHRVDYHSAGQGPLVHYHAATGGLDWHHASMVPLGIMPDAVGPRPAPLELAPGDILALLTDGFYEYQDARGAQFGQAGVGAVLREHHAGSAPALCDALLAALGRFAPGAPQLDDLTAVIVKRAE